MHIEIGKNLSHKLRSLADKAHHRLWIAVPYGGGLKSVSSVIGNRWYSDHVNFRLLTDTDNKAWLDRGTIEVMKAHGKIKHLKGLHAKVYIADDSALLTSANLTENAFSRRREIGVFLTPKESKLVIKTFQDWWDGDSKLPKAGWLKTLKKSTSTAKNEEPNGYGQLPRLFALPSTPPEIRGSHPFFRNFKEFKAAYEEFADDYKSAGN